MRPFQNLFFGDTSGAGVTNCYVAAEESYRAEALAAELRLTYSNVRSSVPLAMGKSRTECQQMKRNFESEAQE
jgi:hypothetical protein